MFVGEQDLVGAHPLIGLIVGMLLVAVPIWWWVAGRPYEVQLRWMNPRIGAWAWLVGGMVMVAASLARLT